MSEQLNSDLLSDPRHFHVVLITYVCDSLQSDPSLIYLSFASLSRKTNTNYGRRRSGSSPGKESEVLELINNWGDNSVQEKLEGS